MYEEYKNIEKKSVMFPLEIQEFKIRKGVIHISGCRRTNLISCPTNIKQIGLFD